MARLNDLGVDAFKVGGSLLGSIAQRLLRRICPQCKEPCEPNAKLLATLFQDQSIPEDAIFFHGRGCKKCLGSGYAGRIPIFEVMVVSLAMADAIEKNVSASKLREIAVSEGMIELASAGVEQVLAGNTTLEEVFYKISS